MSKQDQTTPNADLTLESALQQYFAAEPSAGFLTALEQKLLAAPAGPAAPAAQGQETRRAAPAPAVWRQLAALLRPRPATVALALLLILAISLLIIGPQRAWAGLQSWLGYVPGVGFVNLEDTRVLLAPATQERDGVTLRVSELIAGPEETTIVVESSGLPSEEALWGMEGASVDDRFAPLLRLPDGAPLNVETFTLRLGRGTLVFPPLPPDVYRLTLELPLLPLVPPGAAPENWSLPLLLQPATGELVGAMYPQPYSPQGASDTHHGVTLTVLQVAHTPQQTAFTVQAQWQDESWAHVRPEAAYNSFYDDVGHIYSSYVGPHSGSVATLVQRVQPGEAPPPQTFERAFNFGPVSLAAGRLTFEIPEVDVNVPATDSFTIDLGPQPQVGDSWDLDIHLDVAGFPVHITRAWIATEQLGRPSDMQERTNLYFYLQPVAPQAHRRLTGFGLTTTDPAFQGSGGSGLQLRHLTLAEDAQMPAGALEVRVLGASVALSGPWLLSWELPDAPALAPTLLNPDQVATASGLSLRLDRVALTDRITAVELTLADAPAGVALEEILSGIPGERQRRLRLEDDRLHDYWFEGGGALWWQPDGPAALSAPPGPSIWTAFPPPRPLARSMTLHIPTILLARADDAAFSFDVPDPHSRSFTPDPAGFGGEHSEPWPIDAHFTVAGYDIHFTEASFFKNGPTSGSIRLGGVARTVDGATPWLHDLRVTSVSGPHGATLHGDPSAPAAPFSALPHGLDSLARCDGRRDTCEVTFIFPVSDPRTGQIEAGRYQVTLEGVDELRQGPWEFSWSLTAAPDGAEAGSQSGSAPRLVQSYAPAGAIDSAGGVALQALAVAHTKQETAVHAQARWEDGFWEWSGFDGAGVVGAPLLSDGQGQVYAPVSPENRPLRVITEVIDTSQTPTPPPHGAAKEDTAWFEPLAPSAERLTLQLDRLWFSAYPASHPFRFTLDLGDDPQFGARWPLDIAFDIGGFPLHFTDVRLEQGTEALPFKLLFTTGVGEGAVGRLESITVGLGRNVRDFGGAAHSSTTLRSRAGKLEPIILLAALPPGPFTIVVDSATMAVDGPWQLNWEVMQKN